MGARSLAVFATCMYNAWCAYDPVALPTRKPVVDANADHRVVDPLERARRIDCAKARAESTNLLANVVMLAVDLAKNAVDDSGCKW